VSSRRRTSGTSNVPCDVLQTQRYPEILFESTRITPQEVIGQLTLHGVTREVRFAWREEGEARVAEVRLDQRTWGIVPFHAMMGALRLKPEVHVRVRLTR
jgi:polyisoprenoid-binding protein YceI